MRRFEHRPRVPLDKAALSYRPRLSYCLSIRSPFRFLRIQLLASDQQRLANEKKDKALAKSGSPLHSAPAPADAAASNGAHQA